MKLRSISSIFCLLLGLIAALLTGCASNSKGNITSVTQSVIGIDISQSADSAVPHVRLGFVRSQYHVVPTGTNMYAPAVISSINLSSGVNENEISEDFATGGATRDLAGSESPAKIAAAKRHGPRTNAPAIKPAAALSAPVSTVPTPPPATAPAN
jgi:hypothetical protein